MHPWVTGLPHRPARPPVVASRRRREEPFSTPRSWHMLSDALRSFGPTASTSDDPEGAGARHAHARARRRRSAAYAKIVRHRYGIEAHPQGRRPLAAPRPRTATCCTTSPRRSAAGWSRSCRTAASTPRPNGCAQTAYRAKALLVELAEISRRGRPDGHRRRRRRQPGAARLVPGRGRPRHAAAGRGPAPEQADARHGSGTARVAGPEQQACRRLVAAAGTRPTRSSSRCRQASTFARTAERWAAGTPLPAAGHRRVDVRRAALITCHPHPPRRSRTSGPGRSRTRCCTWASATSDDAGDRHRDSRTAGPRRPLPGRRPASCSSFALGRAPESRCRSCPDGDRGALAARWRRDGVPAACARCCAADGDGDPTSPAGRRGAAAGHRADGAELACAARRWVRRRPRRWTSRPARRDAATRRAAARRRPWERALGWFVSSYPLLGGLAAGLHASSPTPSWPAPRTSASPPSTPAAARSTSTRCGRLTDEEWRFVLAHEMLHAALRHGDRGGARDPYLFNVAADYVINGWLVEMGVGDDARAAAVRPGAEGPVGRGGVRPDRHRPAPAAAARDAARAGPRRHPRRAAAARRRPTARRRPGRVLPPRRWPRASTCHERRARHAARPGWSRRSGRSATRRCPGTCSWPAGSTSSCPLLEPRAHATPARPGGRRPRRTSRAPGWLLPGGGGRARARSASCWTPPARWTAPLLGKALGAIASLRHRPRRARGPGGVLRRGRLRRRLPAGRRHRRPGAGAAAAAARCCSRASTCWSAPTTSPPTARSWSSPTASATALRVRREHAFLIPDGARAAVHPARPGLPPPLTHHARPPPTDGFVSLRGVPRACGGLSAVEGAVRRCHTVDVSRESQQAPGRPWHPFAQQRSG